MTALMFAIAAGSAPVVTALLQCEKEIDLQARDQNGKTALMHATITGATDIVTQLLWYHTLSQKRKLLAAKGTPQVSGGRREFLCQSETTCLSRTN